MSKRNVYMQAKKNLFKKNVYNSIIYKSSKLEVIQMYINSIGYINHGT